MKFFRSALSGNHDPTTSSRSCLPQADRCDVMKAPPTTGVAVALLLFPPHFHTNSFATAHNDSIRPGRSANGAGLPVYTRININRIAAWYNAWGIDESAHQRLD